jgi:ABC-2 type transport system permease protein
MKSIKKLIVYLLLVVSLLCVSNIFYYRLDLTAEKRYTLSDKTKSILDGLKEDVYVEVYLDGELPPPFKRLHDRVNELLVQCANDSKIKLHFQFFDPSTISDKKKKDDFINQLISRGVLPTTINKKTSDELISQQLIFPSMLVWNSKKEIAVNLLKNNPAFGAEENINNSIEALEYELVNAVNVISQNEKKSIAFLEGQGELSKIETADIGGTLADFYNVDILTTDKLSRNMNKYSALVIAQPRKDFSEKDKYIIDQFIMNGGSSLWLIDQVSADLDSLRYKSEILAYSRPLNIEDMLFTYGIRINPNLVLDGQCVLIPVKTSLENEPAKFSPAPWYYSPLIMPNQNNPIGKNVNPIRFDFTNTIDTLGGNANIKKDILLMSSRNTRLVNVPWPVSLDIVNEKMNPEVFNQSSKILGVGLRGIFPSVFRHRILDFNIGFEQKKESLNTKMIIVSDGDIIRNSFSGTGDNLNILPLGYDRYTKRTYGNKAFLLNAINYLCDNSGLTQLRNREFRLRILDKTKLKSERIFWQSLNILLPLILLIALAIIWYFVRKKTYSKR